MTRGASVCKWASFSPGCSPRQHLTSGRELMTTIFLRRLLHHNLLLLLLLLPLPRPPGRPRLPYIVSTAVICAARGSLLFCFSSTCILVSFRCLLMAAIVALASFFGSYYLLQASADSCPISFPSYMSMFNQSKERIRSVENPPLFSLQVTDSGGEQSNVCASNYAYACQVGPVTLRLDAASTRNSHKVI